MNLKKLSILLVVLLGGMAIYYNISTSNNANGVNNASGENASKVEKSK